MLALPIADVNNTHINKMMKLTIQKGVFLREQFERDHERIAQA